MRTPAHYLFLFLSLLLLSFMEDNFMKQSDAERAGLKGKVKRVSENQYAVSGAVPDDLTQYKPDVSSTERYNTDGNLVSRRRYVRNDSLWSTSTYGYDGRRRIWLAFDDGDTIRYSYDQRGNMIETLWPPGSLYSREVFSYDANNRLIRVLDIEENGDTTRRVDQLNDTANHLVRRFVQHGSGKEVYTNSYIYKNGKLIADSSWTDGRLMSANSYVHTKAADGKWTQEAVYNGRSKYDRPRITRREYILDKTGNWTRMKVYRDGQLTTVTYREIEYY